MNCFGLYQLTIKFKRNLSSMWSQGEDVISNLSEMCAQSRKMDQGLTLVLSFFSIWFYKIVVGTGVAGIFLDCFRVRAFLSLSHLFSYLMHSEWLEAKRCLSSEATFGFFFFNYVDLSWHLSFICLQILKILFVSDELFFKKRYCFSCGLFFFPQVFIEFVTTLLLLYVSFFWPWGMWDLSSLTRNQTHIPYIGRWPFKY